MFCPWSGLAGHICYLSSKPFDLILTLGVMATVHREKWCFLREGSGLKRDEMFPAQKLISQCFPYQRKHNSFQNLPWSFRSFKALSPKKGSPACRIGLFIHGPLAKIQIILKAGILMSVAHYRPWVIQKHSTDDRRKPKYIENLIY